MLTLDEAINRIKRNDLPALREALEGGLDPNLSSRSGSTLLMAAAMEGCTDIGGLLCLAGAEVDAASSHYTALGLALLKGHPRFVKMLLEYGAAVAKFDTWNMLNDWTVTRDWLKRHSCNTDKSLASLDSLFGTAQK